MKCEGLDCFQTDDLASSVDCLSGGCYVGINSDGETKRDCSIAVSNSSSCTTYDNQSANCLVCQDDFCNAIAFPMTNRLICKECLGETCEENILEDKYCERFSQNERCVSVFSSAEKVVERGCLSTVQNVAACNASDPYCMQCAFNSCNVQNSRDEKYHCYSCDSQNDPSCVTNSTAVATTSCTTHRCFSRLLTVASGSAWTYVLKGCAAKLPTSYNCTGMSCSTCIGNLCNNVIYPSDRISCLSCEKDECKQANVTSKTCELYNESLQGCVTLYDENNEVFHRGCYADVAEGIKEVCDDSSQLLCTKCTTNNCNNDNVRRGKKCFKCHGIECFIPVMPADVVDCLSDCYMGIDEHGESVRGCANVFTNTTACGDDDDGVNRCNVCTDDFCNGVQFPLVNRLQCHKCVDENCEPTDDTLDFCELYHQQERCITVLSHDDKVVERGCSSSYGNQRYCNMNYDNCLKCSTNGCNSFTSRLDKMCIVCDSNTNPNCVLNPTSIATLSYCKRGCYTRLVNKTLHRGCSDDLDAGFVCSDDSNCQYCNDGDKCNVGNYPSDRRSCITCSGIANCANATSQTCINYRKSEKCSTIFNYCKFNINF